MLAVVDGSPDDDLVGTVLFNVDNVHRPISRRLGGARVTRLRLQPLVADGLSASALGSHARGRDGHHRQAAAQCRCAGREQEGQGKALHGDQFATGRHRAAIRLAVAVLPAGK